jgi:hypothetical protein
MKSDGARAADLRFGIGGHQPGAARSGLVCTARCSPGLGGTRGFVTDEHRRSTKPSNRDENTSAPDSHIRRSGAL